MSDDPRMDRLEAKVEATDAKAERADTKAERTDLASRQRAELAGTPTDEPHQEMAQTVAEATVEAGATAAATRQRNSIIEMRRLVRDVKWMLVVALLVVGLIIVLSK